MKLIIFISNIMSKEHFHKMEGASPQRKKEKPSCHILRTVIPSYEG